ncbi:hypothetical protein AFLA70_48g004071 [Aspergillus flavus AF70]|nr:hypothetical protein AFLA70_48g004071 [Aspergillus flavus AF70]
MPTWKTSSIAESESGFLRKTSEVRNERWGMKALVSKIKKKKKYDLDDFLVIGIDFGTTYSGAAWATVDDFERDEINLITSWPNHGREEGKAPTELFYEDGKVMWGYDIPSDADPVRWFKLLLLREEDMAEELRQSEFILRGRKMIRETGKSAIDLIADYLRALWQHTLDTIHKARSKSVIAALTFQVVITVPAIWKDYARQGMEEAARRAGILQDRPAGPTVLSFAPEPEAAALATLCERERDIESGDVYVICDAGGGTVDLITYRVGDLDPIEIHEAVIGTGGLCGGIFIDEAFEAICRDRLGRQWNKLSQTGIKHILKEQWEYGIKAKFKPKNTGEEFPVAIPAEAFQGSDLNDHSRKPFITNGRIHFSSSDIQKAFTPIFADIEGLLNEQIAKSRSKSLPVKNIILVGGLGSSPYLYEHLSERYERDGIDIIQSTGIRPYASSIFPFLSEKYADLIDMSIRRTAICRGAIVKGFLDGPSAAMTGTPVLSVVSTIARQSLGVAYSPLFDESRHLEKDRDWDGDEGVWRASNQMMWYLRKGDDVFKAEPVRHEFYRTYADKTEFTDSLTETILQCDDDKPPSRRNSSVKELCKIRINRRHVSFNSLEDYMGKNGQHLKKWVYDIEMVPSGASNEFAVIYQGKRLGSEKADIEFQ